jgi:hypothetical protein
MPNTPIFWLRAVIFMGCCAKLGGTVFRRLFLESLQKAFDAGKLQFFGALDSLREARGFARCIARAKNSEWVVYAKRPFAGPEQVLDYVGRYTHRVALSNNRLLDIENGQVRFQWKNLSGQRPDPNDDFIGRRVHPAVLTACVAERFPTHSLLRFSGKSLPATETCPVSPLTRHADAKPRHRCHAGAGLPRPLRTPHRLFVAAVSAMLARSHGNRRHPAKIREMSLPCSNHHRFVMSATPDPKLATPRGWPGPVWSRSVTWTFLSDSLNALRASHMPTLHLLLSKPDDSKLIVRPFLAHRRGHELSSVFLSLVRRVGPKMLCIMAYGLPVHGQGLVPAKAL